MCLSKGKIWSLTVAVTFFILFLFTATTYACTGVRLVGEDGTAVFGRTQEWGKFDLNAKVAVIARGTSFQGKTPEGKNGLRWDAKYGFVGTLLLDRAFCTGLNERGLSAGFFYHEGFAEYADFDVKKADQSIAPSDVLSFILSSFSTLEEVREGLKQEHVVAVVDPALHKTVPMHLMITEPGGDCMVIEFKDGQAKFFDNPVGVIANNPTFDWHLTNLRNYGFLSQQPFHAKKWGELEITPLAAGSGLLGLPGDFTSPSRFVRATVFSQTSRPTEGGLDTVQEVFRILDSFQLPASQSEGTNTGNEAKDSSLPSGTQYTVVTDTKNLVMYYHTMFNRRIRKIDLKAIDFSTGTMRSIPLDEKRKQDIREVTGMLQ
ncbi:MAG: choloylglycine hydrolase [delta proteobacterium MLS_D]|jgi:choloylglycine hydrolase|nr:MAG: choloylglycine hydrolase [delta proteobacterium MLS_D]